jgi:transcriptional regulator with XRE-family HTH domain
MRLQEERTASDITLVQAAAQIGVSSEMIESIEKGETAPSLPELELLAYLYRVPLTKLLGAPEVSEAPVRIKEDKKNAFLHLRTRIIASTLKQARLSANLSLDDLSTKLGIPLNTLEEYEAGTLPIPQPLLSVICSALGVDMDSLISPLSPKIKPSDREVSSTILDEQLNEFVTNPVNLPYIYLAKKLSTLDAAKLREIAENLLEITY